MSWNYRVVLHKHPKGDIYKIHEVYYDDEGEIEGMTEEPVEPHGETFIDLDFDLSAMRVAMGDPVIDYDTIEEIDE